MIKNVVLLSILSVLPATLTYAQGAKSAAKSTESKSSASKKADSKRAAKISPECKFNINGNDEMHYTATIGSKPVISPAFDISIPKSCPLFEITLTHIGKLPKEAMGHNIVIAETANLEKIATGGSTFKDKDYIDPKADSLVIAHSSVVGGGDHTTATIDTTKLDPKKDYSFFCTFPGHFALMKGKVLLVDKPVK
ncbi:MAG: azurin [Chitinophagaceae bacterium]|nr:azurin [Oligoflexus sp.]